jgi:hypothetical protein
MKIPLLAIALFAMTSCVTVVQPTNSSRPVTTTTVSVVTIEPRLRIPVYPNSQMNEIEGDKNKTKVTFSSRDGLEQVNAHFHREIVSRGFTRTKYELKSNASKIEAEYRKDKQKLEYKLDKVGNSGQFKLELDLDD